MGIVLVHASNAPAASLFSLSLFFQRLLIFCFSIYRNNPKYKDR